MSCCCTEVVLKGLFIISTICFLSLVGFAFGRFHGWPTNEDSIGNEIDIDLVNTTHFGDSWMNNNEPNDAYGLINPNQTIRWKIDTRSTSENGSFNNDGTVGGGLSLDIWNALDDNWQDEFLATVTDWDDGIPDALNIQTKKLRHMDEEDGDKCKQIHGAMKVCNGNFGETGWLGINEFLTQSGYIVASVAKMNDYYLSYSTNNGGDADNAHVSKSPSQYYERQYAMCHEIGHGLGLPHTDENFYNIDLGNCMDYTRIPQNNLHPGKINFERLAELYGSSNKVRRLSGGRLLGRQRIPDKVSTKVYQMYNDAIIELHSQVLASNEGAGLHRKGRNNGWQLHQKHKKGARYSKNLTDEYKLEVHILLSTD